MSVESALFRAMFPDDVGWTTQNMLLAELVDTGHWLQWAKTRDGQRGRGMPPKIQRPGTRVKPRPGLKPAAAPLSVVKKLLGEQYDPDRAQKLKTLFDGR